MTGHCVYCGGFAFGNVCVAHRDLPRLDPVFRREVVFVPLRHQLDVEGALRTRG